MRLEIPTELQTNIEKAADALIEDENDEITKAIIIRPFLSLKTFKEPLLK